MRLTADQTAILRRLRRIGPRKRVALLLMLLSIALVAIADRGLALPIVYTAVMTGLAILGYLLMDLRRTVQSMRWELRSRGIGQPKASGQTAKATSVGTGSERLDMKNLAKLERRLWTGFHTEALKQLRQRSTAPDVSSTIQGKAFLAMGTWHAFVGEWGDALRCSTLARVAEPALTLDADQPALEIDALVACGQHSEARARLEYFASVHQTPSMSLRLANTWKGPQPDSSTDPDVEAHWLDATNEVFLRAGLAPIAKSDPSLPLSIDNITSKAAGSIPPRSELVSVIIPAYNCESTIGTALRSLLVQTWAHLEILVVDDASPDGTAEVVRSFVAADERVRLIQQEQNGGPYAARNAGLRQATGDIITTHDADDWSHPQRIERQAQPLISKRRLVGTRSHLVRVSSDLRFLPPTRPAPKLIRPNMSSLMLRREAFRAVGDWDEVRAAGDSEFLHRCQTFFGSDRISDEQADAPLSFARVSPNSLTSGATTGLPSMYHAIGARHQYREASRRWHAKVGFADALPWHPDQMPRPYYCPPALTSRSSGDPAEFDIVMLSNFSLPGGTTSSNIQEIEAQARAEMTTALVHHPVFGWRDTAMNPKVWDTIDAGRAELLSKGDQASCDILTIRFPRIMQHPMDDLPRIEAKHVAVVVNQTPMRSYDEAPEVAYDLRTCHENLHERFGDRITWYPLGPQVRQALLDHHENELSDIHLAGEDWPNIIDVPAWERRSRRVADGKIRIGRHSRDSDVKWPEDSQSLRSAYPANSPYEVHVLGGASAAAEVLGRLPANWVVHEFDSMLVRDFLHGLDVYVYFTHSGLVEAFGRALLEALAVGLPVITSPKFEPLFGDGAIYGQPDEVTGIVNHLMGDPEAYETQAAKALKVVRDRFSYSSHTQRLHDFAKR